MSYYYQPTQNVYEDGGDLRKLVMEKVSWGLGVSASISLLMTLLIPYFPAILLLSFVGFIGEIVAIIVYFFSRTEATIERFYGVFVVSSALVLGATMYMYAAAGGFAIVAWATAITAGIFGGSYYYTYRNRPDVAQLGRFLMVFGLIFIGVFIFSIFVNPGLIGGLVFSIFAAILFSLYLFYDLGRMMRGQFRSPARMAWSIYWDVLLIFKYMLRIMYLLTSDR